MAQGRIAFIYGAQGTQWPGMGRDLMLQDATYERVIRRCDLSIRRHFDWSLCDEMLAEPRDWRIHGDWRFVQPAVTALQIALTEALRERGLAPDGVGSLSMGEAAAMYAAGAIDLDDAIDIACSVARLGETTLQGGLMAMICAADTTCRDLIGDAASEVAVAIEIGPARTVVSGEEVAVRAVLAKARRCGLVGVPLPMVQAYHSPNVASLGAAFMQRLSGLRHQPARMDVYSSVTACVLGHLDLEHWWHVCSRPARFHSMGLNMIRDGYRHFIEIGPHAMLGQAIEETAAGVGVAVDVHAAMRRGADAVMRLTQLANRYAPAGVA